MKIKKTENTDTAGDAAAAKDDNDNNTDDKKEPSPEPPRNVNLFEYKYNPANSFFDDLDLLDRSNMDFKQRRKIDAQTFGQEAENYKVRRRRRRGGNGRRRRRQYNRY